MNNGHQNSESIEDHDIKCVGHLKQDKYKQVASTSLSQSIELLWDRSQDNWDADHFGIVSIEGQMQQNRWAM